MGCIIECLTCCGCCKWMADEITCMHREYDDSRELEYHYILRYKGKKAVWYQPPKSKYTIGQIKFKQDLARGKIVYHNDYWEDLIFYARNDHFYFSPWTAERLHPFSRSERLVVMIMTVIMALCLAFMRAGLIAYDRELAEEDEDYEKKAEIQMTKVIMGILSPIIIWIFSYILKYFGKCSCAQGASFVSCRSCLEKLSHLIMILFGSFVMFWFVLLGAAYAADSDVNPDFVMVNFIWNTALTCFGTTLLFMIIIYEVKRRREVRSNNKSLKRESREKEAKFKFNVPVSWYLDWKAAGEPKCEHRDGPLTQEDIDEAHGKWATKAKKMRDSFRRKTGGSSDLSKSPEIAAAVAAERGAVQMTPQLIPNHSGSMGPSVPPMHPVYQHTYSNSVPSLTTNSSGGSMIMLTPTVRPSGVLASPPVMAPTMGIPPIRPVQQAVPNSTVVVAGPPGSRVSVVPGALPVVYQQPNPGIVTYVQHYPR